MKKEERQKTLENYTELTDCKCSRLTPYLYENAAETLRNIYKKQKMINDGLTPVIINTDLAGRFLEFYFKNDKEKYKEYRNDALLPENTEGGGEMLSEIYEKVYNDCQWFFDDLSTEIRTELLKSICSDKSFDYSGEHIVLRVPEKEPWKVFSHIPFGYGNIEFYGFKDKKFPYMDTVRAARFFYEQFGAVPCYIDFCNIEFCLKKPPDLKTVYASIPQIFAFCFDMIDRYDSAVSYAEWLCGSPIWHFWWD